MKKAEINPYNLLMPGAKLNFLTFSKLEIAEKNLEYLNIEGSAILSGELIKICFYNASFFSTKFLSISFLNCDLKSTDICSIWAKKCHFQSCDFSNATVSDSTFINCAFDSSIFKCISMTRCQFIDCTFEEFMIDDSTFSLNTFTKCKINNTHFTESFFYQIFDDCTFEHVKMSPALLGYNFGFSNDVFMQLISEENIAKICTDFIEKGLYINAAILRINQIQSYYDEAMVACVAALVKMIQNDILVKADEIEFLKSLTSLFETRKQIAPISILRIWQLLTDTFTDEPENTAISKSTAYIREYKNMIYFSFMNFQTELQKLLNKLPIIHNSKEIAELEIVYSIKPETPLLEYLIQFSNLSRTNCPEPRLIRTEKGSFREFLEIAAIIIPYLQTFFAFLGVVVPIVIYKKQTKDAQSKETMEKNTKNENAVVVSLEIEDGSKSPILLPNTATIIPFTNELISNTVKILSDQQIIKQLGFGGYNTQNIQSIIIRFR